MKHRSIAIFIPHLGCPHQCSFCNQHSIASTVCPPAPEEVAALCKDALNDEGRWETEIAFFGGSFTAIERAYMVQLLEAASPFVKSGQAKGIRISTRPDAITTAVLDVLKAYGVTTIELGAQSMDETVLQEALRGHTPNDVVRAATLIHRWGFTLGLQMMLGLKGDTPQKAFVTAEQLAALHPQEVRIYPTVVLRDTPLAQQYAKGLYQPLPLEDGVELSARLLDYFEAAGISVIRVGLHASKEIEAQMVAGCYHPAFRELCESRRMLRQVMRKIDVQGIPKGLIRLEVAPQWRSQLVGQKKENLKKLAEAGYRAEVAENPSLQVREIIINSLL